MLSHCAIPLLVHKCWPSSYWKILSLKLWSPILIKKTPPLDVLRQLGFPLKTAENPQTRLGDRIPILSLSKTFWQRQFSLLGIIPRKTFVLESLYSKLTGFLGKVTVDFISTVYYKNFQACRQVFPGGGVWNFGVGVWIGVKIFWKKSFKVKRMHFYGNIQ